MAIFRLLVVLPLILPVGSGRLYGVCVSAPEGMRLQAWRSRNWALLTVCCPAWACGGDHFSHMRYKA